MENFISFEEAVQIAKNWYGEYNETLEYTDAWYFYVNDGIFRDGGPKMGTVILKETGARIPPYEYFFGDKYKGVLVGEAKKI